MPRGDATGPEGRGPRTGRGAGYCAGFDAPGSVNPYPAPGFGMGFGRGGGGRHHRFFATGLPGWLRHEKGYPPYGRGFRGRRSAPSTTEQNLDLLQNQAEFFEGRLEEIKRHIEELAADKKEA
jgi:hypothetical protein